MYRNFALLFVVVFGLLLCCLFFSTPSPTDPDPQFNVRVSEDSFGLLAEGMSQEQVYAVLGNPGLVCTGRIVRVEKVRDPDLKFSIQRTSDSTDPLFLYYGVNDENIKVLFSAGRVSATEFCFGEYPVVYKGNHNGVSGPDWIAATGHSTPNAALQARIDAFRQKLALRQPSCPQAPAVPDQPLVPPVDATPVVVDRVAEPVRPAMPVREESPVREEPLPVHTGPLSLPSGLVFRDSSFEPEAGWQNTVANDAFVDFHPNQALAMVASTKGVKLEGTAASFDSNGSLECLASYHNNQLNGKLRVFQKGDRLYYGEYSNGRKSGFSCFCQSNRPCLLEEYSDGDLLGRYLIQPTDGGYALVAEKDLTVAQRRLLEEAVSQQAVLDRTLQGGEVRLKQRVSDYVLANAALKNQMRSNRANNRTAQMRLSQELQARAFWNTVLGGVRFDTSGRVYTVVPVTRRYYKQ